MAVEVHNPIPKVFDGQALIYDIPEDIVKTQLLKLGTEETDINFKPRTLENVKRNEEQQIKNSRVATIGTIQYVEKTEVVKTPNRNDEENRGNMFSCITEEAAKDASNTISTENKAIDNGNENNTNSSLLKINDEEDFITEQEEIVKNEIQSDQLLHLEQNQPSTYEILKSSENCSTDEVVDSFVKGKIEINEAYKLIEQNPSFISKQKKHPIPKKVSKSKIKLLMHDLSTAKEDINYVKLLLKKVDKCVGGIQLQEKKRLKQISSILDGHKNERNHQLPIEMSKHNITNYSDAVRVVDQISHKELNPELIEKILYHVEGEVDNIDKISENLTTLNPEESKHLELVDQQLNKMIDQRHFSPEIALDLACLR